MSGNYWEKSQKAKATFSNLIQCNFTPRNILRYILSKNKTYGWYANNRGEESLVLPPWDVMDSTYSIMHFSIHCKEHAFTFRIVCASWSHPGLFFWIKQVRRSHAFFRFYTHTYTHTQHTGAVHVFRLGCRWKAIVWSWFINRLHVARGVVVWFKQKIIFFALLSVIISWQHNQKWVQEIMSFFFTCHSH